MLRERARPENVLGGKLKKGHWVETGEARAPCGRAVHFPPGVPDRFGFHHGLTHHSVKEEKP